MTTSRDDAMQEDVAGPSQVVQPRQPTKRKIVDANNDNIEIADPKRANMKIDADQKYRVLAFLCNAFGRVCTIMGIEGFFDIYAGAIITSLIYTAHNILRQESNNTGNLKQHRTKEHNLILCGKQVTVKMNEVIDQVKTAAKDQNLNYEKPGAQDRNHWYGTANPLLTYCTSFKSRLEEVRTGHAQMRVKKDALSETIVKVSQFGVQPKHYPLCEGVNYAPERKSSMPQSLGPLTQLMMLIREKKPDYRDKWRKAVARSFDHIPGIEALITSIEGKTPSEVAPIIGLLGDIALIAGARSQHRAFIPLNMLCVYLFSTESLGHYTTAIKTKMLPIKMPLVPGRIVDFSGKGLWAFYKLISQGTWKINGNFTPESAGQVVVHAMLGTHLDDLSVLEQVTSHNTWFTRAQIGTQFQQMGSCPKVVTFALPTFNYFSKLSSAAPTNLLAGGESQLHCVPVFSGYRRQAVIDKFIESFDKNAIAGISLGRDLRTIEVQLSQIRDRLVRIVKTNNGRIDMGTTPWVNMDDYEKYYKSEVVQHVIIVAKGKYFLGSSSS